MNKSKLIGFFGLITILIVGLFLILWIVIWIKKSRETNKVNNYFIVIYDLNGQITAIEDIRLNFKNNDVAWSFMKEYKNLFPFHNFGLISRGKNPKQQMIIKYL
ncbi:MAG: hypothetical protein ACE5RR_07245 [Nitrosarchaeum sp.]